MADRMPDTWKLPSPIGGTYRWVYTTEDDPAERSAYIELRDTITNPIVLSRDRLREIDQDMDDGDSTTGRIQLKGLNIRLYVRQQPTD